RIEFHGVAREPSYLVVAAAYDPDWHAYVDGAAVPVFRANQMFRAVPLAAGMHDVVFVYRPAALYVGAGVTLIVVLFIVSAWYMRRREDAMQTDATDVVR
ncbi:MAG TPA: YfhO family protein, partial [Ramlibacter sp.]|nr:YfhO family protein [Ramlibacter sp.]